MTFDVRPDFYGEPSVYRDGVFMDATDADKLLVHFRQCAKADDWFAPLAEAFADSLAEAIAKTQPQQQSEAA